MIKLAKYNIGVTRNWTILLVKYLVTNSYVPFIMIFLNKFLDNKPKSFIFDDIDIHDNNDIDASGYIDASHDVNAGKLHSLIHMIGSEVLHTYIGPS